jgi:hypothetical protein
MDYRFNKLSPGDNLANSLIMNNKNIMYSVNHGYGWCRFMRKKINKEGF